MTYKCVGRKPGCCFGLQKRGSETPRLEVLGNQLQALFFTLCLREKPCSHSVFWFLGNPGDNHGAVVGPKSLDIFGVNPQMNTSPAPVLMPAPERFLFYLQQEGRRKFLKGGTEASMCQQERSSTDMPSVGTCLT